jgi:hypothetical protein
MPQSDGYPFSMVGTKHVFQKHIGKLQRLHRR